MARDPYGVMCSFSLLLSTLTSSMYTIDMMTPYAVPVDDLLFCGPNVHNATLNLSSNVLRAAGVQHPDHGLRDVAFADPFYAQSYRFSRYDDFRELGVPLDQRDNCTLVSFAAAKNTRYTFDMVFPGPLSALRLYTVQHANASSTLSRYIVRGSKYGTQCTNEKNGAADESLTVPLNMDDVCNTFVAEKQALAAGERSLGAVGEYLEVFANLTAALIDPALMLDAYAFMDTQVDGRRRFSPTHRAGIGPNCRLCDDGWLTDVTTGDRVRVPDRQHKPWAVLQAIGYMINLATGAPCTELFDPAKTTDKQPLLPSEPGGVFF